MKIKILYDRHQIAIFKGKQIRKTIYKNEWWFSVVDVVQVLTDQADDYTARKYWNKLAQRLRDEGNEVVTFCHRLKLKAPDGKMRETDCADTETIFRIVQSIPSPKAEPFKRWLVRVGGGDIAGGARKKLEKRLGRSLVSNQNFLPKKLNLKQLI